MTEAPDAPAPLPTVSVLSPGTTAVMVKSALEASWPSAALSLARTRTRAVVVAPAGTVQA